MRLFLGIEIDEHVRRAATDVAERLERRLARDAPDLHARYIDGPNLHVTLWFIGEVADERAQAIAAVLEHPFETAPFQMGIGGPGAFPPTGRPRVFWLGVQQGSEALAALYEETAARLAPLGFSREARAYSPHLTLARVKDPGRAGARAIREVLEGVAGDCGACPVRGVTLFRSRLSPRGAAYERLLRVPLIAR